MRATVASATLSVLLACLLVLAPAAAAEPIGTVTIANITLPPPPRPPAPPPGGPRPGGRPFQPCKPIACVELARQVCRALGGCKTPSERWRAIPRSRAFVAAIEASGDPRPPGDWTPHHITPIHSQKAWVAQSIAFKAGIRPNHGVNGVWLRGPDLRRGSPGYAGLSAAQRRRVFHADTFGDRYAQLVNRRLLNACPGSRCSRRQVLGVLRGLRGDLTAGIPAFNRPGRPRR